MREFEEKMIRLADSMIDDRINMYGIANTIAFLMDFGFTDDELVEMSFDPDDVANVRASLQVE